MQKSDLIRSKKWAMEEAFLRSVGVLNGRTSMRSWDEPWEISPKNRDRPGGHMFKTYFGHLASNYNGGRSYKKIDKRKARREHRRIVSESLREMEEDRELWLQEMAAEWDDEGLSLSDMMNDYVSDHPHYFEDDYDPFEDEVSYQPGNYYYDPYWDIDDLM